jgi:DNA-directed RNA polymerase subunit RPC12/RpoP
MLKQEQGEEPAKKLHRYPCPGCGADLVFAPEHGALECPYCGRKEAVPAGAGEVEERPYEAYLRPDATRLKRLTEAALEVNCAGCGSVVTFEPPDVAGACPFCGAKIVAQPKAADPLVAPEGVLPFSVTQREATAGIRKWLSSRWFAPNALKKQAQQGAISGVYLPFWTYDAHTESRYTGQRGEHYWDTEWYTETDAQGRTRRKSRQVRKTRWYPASGRVSRRFNDVLIAATRALPRPRLDALEPWDLSQIRPYDPGYLSGYKAQRYQVGLPDGFEAAKDVMAPTIEADVRRDIGGDEQRIHRISTRYADITFKHLLLPVWISAYRYDKKVYQVMVNARTAEVQGDRPYSVWKILFVVLTVLALVAGFCLFAQTRNAAYVPVSPGEYPSGPSVTPAPERATPTAPNKPESGSTRTPAKTGTASAAKKSATGKTSVAKPRTKPERKQQRGTASVGPDARRGDRAAKPAARARPNNERVRAGRDQERGGH